MGAGHSQDLGGDLVMHPLSSTAHHRHAMQSEGMEARTQVP
jgi:hypothetical protein